MFDKIMEYETRPKPEIKQDDFQSGITTRLMAKRNWSSDECRRHSLNFPPGSFIPNSNILLSKQKSQQIIEQDPECHSASGSGITISQLVVYKEESPEKSTTSETPTSTDSPLQKMRESVRRRSRSNSSTATSTSSQGAVRNDPEKTTRRISMRTTQLEVAEVRKLSPESLRTSIDNSNQEVELLDVDDLINTERRSSRGRNSGGRVSFKREGK